MAGLFGLDEDASLGLLTAALAAMSARGVRPGTALAQGGLLGIGAMQNARAGRADSARQKKEDDYRQMQMDDYRQKIADAARMKQGYTGALNAAINPGSPGGMGAVDMGMDAGVQPPTPASFDLQKYAMALRDVDPAKSAELLIPKAQKSPYSEIDPSKYTPDSLAAFKRTGDHSMLRTPQKAPESLLGKVSPGDFTPASVAKFQQTGNHADLVLVDKTPRISNTTNILPGQSKFDETMGKGRAESYLDLQKAGNSARAKIGRLDAIGALLDGIDTGGLTPTGVSIANYAKSLGITLDENLGAKQAADALSKEMALQMRNPSGGAGMPGALSDKDREFLIAMQPGIEKSPAGRKQIIAVQKAIAQRDIDVARMARQYVAKHKQLDEGFYTELAQFADANPLFPSQGNAGAGGSGRITIRRLP